MITGLHVNRYPASVIQQQFWLINRLQPDNTAYHIPSLFQIKGILDTDALKRSLVEVIKRHDTLRTTFATENDQLLQKVADDQKLNFTIVVLDDSTQHQKEEKLQMLVSQEVERPFDLEQGPLLRTTLFRLSNTEHYLLILMHHIITDLRTKDLFSEELSQYYNSYITKKPCSLNIPEHQYNEFALWQKNWCESEKFEAMVSHWQKRLSSHSGYLNLPTDRPRQPVQTVSGGAIPFNLSRNFTASLSEFSRQNNVNNYLTLFAAYLVLLFRYTGQNDIIIGTPFTNRRQEFHKNILGCFVNILPLAFDVSNDLTFEEVLRQVRREMLTAHRNQEAPYELIVSKLQPKRDPSYNPFFQVGFTFEHPMELNFQGIEVIAHKIHNLGSQLDLFLTLCEKNGEIHGFVEYNAELFDYETVQRFATHYEVLVQGIVKNPNDFVSKLPLLTETEKHTILVEWNETKLNLPDEPFLHKLFEEQAEENPDAVALVFDDSQLTYQELNSRSNQLAHYLRSLEVCADTFVGVFMDRSLEMVVALLGILKAGGAYLPLDPSFPDDRLAFMVEDTKVSVLLTQEKLSRHITDPNIQKINLDRDCSEIGNQPITNPQIKLAPENLAYVIYTSGSTGKPKGVQIPHIAVVNFLLSMSKEPGLTRNDVLLAVTTLSFDISVLEIFLPLILGAKTVIASREDAVNGQRLLELLEKSGATVMQATPTTWYLLLAAGWASSGEFKVLCGGEPMPQDLALKLVNRSGNVWNLYGPTETTIWSTIYQVTGGESSILVGRPIANTQLYIVNQKDQPSPVGVAGELLIGGIGVSRGYLNRPNLTEEKFIPNPYSENSNERLYRTGDLACYLPDGNVKLFGRLDNQVKLRGFRIELGEIEAILERYSTVDKAVVLIREEESGGKRLVAYVTLQPNSDYSELELRQYLKKNLPEYMVPSIFVLMEEMPLTPNNKIDRKSLPQPELKRPDVGEELILPQNEIEKNISRAWSEILKIDVIGTHDNFFDLGGDSLLCVQLVMLLEKELNTDIPVVKFFQHPTIKSFAEYINNKSNAQQVLLKKVESRTHLQRKALMQRQRFSKRLNEKS